MYIPDTLFIAFASLITAGAGWIRAEVANKKINKFICFKESCPDRCSDPVDPQ